MKKSFLLLPISMLVLSACTNTSPAPVENADGTLSPGIMQPVSGSGATGSGSWEPEIQQQSLPTSMNQPTYNPQPSYNPQQTYTPPTYQEPAPVAQPKATAPKATKAQSEDFVIPRRADNNAPDYSKIDKGFYQNNTYTVRKGDTMFLIAYIAGIDVKELAAMNNMTEPYQLSVGQVLKVNKARPTSTTATAPTAPAMPAQPVEPEVTYRPAPNGTQYGSDGSITGPVKAGTGSTPPAKTGSVTAGVGTVSTTSTPSYQPIQNTQPAVVSGVNWRWPATGKVIQGFSSADGGNKGIDISGSRGQAVNAAAAGRVVYAGHALQGYGNLIIIKHNDDFLSAYAHNDSILVKDQQQVSAGQQIAKMGSTDTSSVRLHFEIRQRGESVDPMRYLPRQ